MKKEKIIILIITTIFIAIIFPMIYIAKYNHSSADDYSYGVETHKTWEETHSIIKVIEKGIEKTKNIYNDWQGSFSAVFLMAIQPAVFGEKIYAIPPIIIMGIFIISNMYTLKIILKNYFKCNNISYIMISFAIILMSIEFVTYPVESFYWYNGSIYYTFFYSIMILMFGIMLKMLKEEKISKKDIIASTILAFLIGGSNYTTALITSIILFLITIVLMYKKDKKSKYILLLLISSFISLIISCIAPGNSVRQSGLVKMTPINAIMKSLEWAKMYIIRFNNITSVLFYIALVPVITKMIKKTNYKFKYPVIFTVITFGIFAAQFTPPLYAQSGYIPKRLYCIIYYSMYWLIIGNLFYWVGYLNKKIDITYDEKMYKVLCTILVILVIASVGINFKTTNTYKAIYSLYSGEAQTYDVEMNERIKIYNDDSIKDVEVKKLTKKPFLLYETDITTNKEHWINLAVRDFFEKNSVRLIK